MDALTTVSKKCISNTFLSIWRHARQNADLEGSKKVQKSGFKIDREPTDTVPKQTSSMFFSDPEKSMCQKTKATKHVSTPPIAPSQKVITFLTKQQQHERQILQSVLECEHGRNKRFAQLSSKFL